MFLFFDNDLYNYFMIIFLLCPLTKYIYFYFYLYCLYRILLHSKFVNGKYYHSDDGNIAVLNDVAAQDHVDVDAGGVETVHLFVHHPGYQRG